MAGRLPDPTALMDWAEGVRDFVLKNGTLPDVTSLEQVDDFVAKARADLARSPSDRKPQRLYLSLLHLAGVCATMLGRDRKTRETFVTATEKLLKRPDSWLWAITSDIAPLCSDCGTVLCELDREHEAVKFGRRVKPLLEAALHKRCAAEDADKEKREVLFVVFLRDYKDWLVKGGLSSSEEVREADSVLDQAIRMLEPYPHRTDLLAMLFETRSKVLNLLEAEDQSLRVLQRGLQIPEVRAFAYPRLATRAICCLVDLRRDTQAEAMIAEILDYPQPLAREQLWSAHYQHAIVIYRRGMLAQAREAATKAIDQTTALLLLGSADAKKRESALRSRQSAQLLLGDVLESMGERAALALLELELGEDAACVRPSFTVRRARKQLAGGRRSEALTLLRSYTRSFAEHGFVWHFRGQWKGEVVAPLEMLRDLLEQGCEERAQVVALIKGATREEEELRRQALEELQREMRAGRGQEEGSGKTEATGQAGGGGGRSKSSRKKKKKRERRSQQRCVDQAGGAEEAPTGGVDGAAMGLDVGSLSLEDGQERAVAAEMEVFEEEEEEECPMCLQEFGGDEEREGREEVLGCGHRYHDVCMDRWLCKCNEKGLPATCPTCRREVVRTATGAAAGGRAGS